MKALLITLFFTFNSLIQAPRHTITIQVSGLRNSNGKIILDVFNSKNGYPMKTENAILRRSTRSSIEAEFVITDLPQGEYAFALIHDENSNNILDQNFLGIPTEGAAASNNAKGFMSPPSYEKAKFSLNKNITMNITMLYF